jgi:hypothetical protein
MFGRPDSQSFTRLLISLGAALCVAAFVGPGFVLRDTGTLRITEQELNRLTPEARKAMVHRQHVAADAGEWAPWAILILFVPGAVLVVIGALRLLPQERVDLEHRDAEKDIAKRQLRAQTPDEVERARRDEVAKQLPAEQAAAAETSPGELRRQAVERIKLTGEIEREVHERLKAILEAQGGEIRDYPSFRAPDGTSHSFDALLLPPKKRPQILVEVKFSPNIDPASMSQTVRALDDLVSAFQATFSVAAQAWLIIVADTISASAEIVIEATALLYDGLTVSVIRPDEIGSLELPD